MIICILEVLEDFLKTSSNFHLSGIGRSNFTCLKHLDPPNTQCQFHFFSPWLHGFHHFFHHENWTSWIIPQVLFPSAPAKNPSSLMASILRIHQKVIILWPKWLLYLNREHGHKPVDGMGYSIFRQTHCRCGSFVVLFLQIWLHVSVQPWTHNLYASTKLFMVQPPRSACWNSTIFQYYTVQPSSVFNSWNWIHTFQFLTFLPRWRTSPSVFRHFSILFRDSYKFPWFYHDFPMIFPWFSPIFPYISMGNHGKS